MLQRAALGLLFGISICWATSAAPQALLPKMGRESVVFIHCGPREPNDPLVRDVAIALLQRGFLVREPETDQDKVGGPGVDYFDQSAAETAQQIAQLVNETLVKGVAVPQGKPLLPRLQRASTPSFYFGVWLF